MYIKGYEVEIIDGTDLIKLGPYVVGINLIDLYVHINIISVNIFDDVCFDSKRP